MNEHNIIIEFGSSLNADGSFKQYEVANGSVFNFDYNETLDSATILIPHVYLKDRLWNIKPYDFVRVYDAKSEFDQTTGRYAFDHNYLIDNFNETEENIEENIFSYTINLMSETKLLEKIQCPNLAITHNIKNSGEIEQRTIYDYLYQYCKLYSPKAKIINNDGETWSYKPVIQFPGLATQTLKAIQSDITNGYADTDGDTKFIANHEWAFLNDDYQTITVNLSYYETTQNSVQGIMANLTINNSCDDILILKSNSIVASTRDPENPSSSEFVNIVLTKDIILYPHKSLGNLLNITNGEISDASVFIPKSLLIDNEREDDWQYFFGLLRQCSYILETEWPFTEQELFTKFNVIAADMTFTAPTLRQLFTLLMEQVGCIPTVVNRTLSYLDFRAEPASFAKGTKTIINDQGQEIVVPDYTVNNTVSKIARSLSSDSYVNTLVSMDSQLLDDGNTIVNEVIGFRDKESLLLKQEENLYLETTYPIYKINNFKILCPYMVNYGNTFKNILPATPQQNWYPLDRRDSANPYDFMLSLWESSDQDYNVYLKCNDIDAGILTTPITYNGKIYTHWAWYIEDATFYFFEKYEVEDENHNKSFYYVFRQKYHYTNRLSYPNQENYIEFPGWIGSNLTRAVRVVGKMYPVLARDTTGNHTWEITEYPDWMYNPDGIPFTKECDFFIGTGYTSDDTTSHGVSYGDEARHPSCGFAYQVYMDLNPFIKENQVRGLLNANFVAMADRSQTNTVEQFTQYIYANLGYSVGDNKISGFSEKYLVGDGTAVGWIQQDYTYIETILTFIKEISGATTLSLYGTEPIYKYAVFDSSTSMCIYDKPISDVSGDPTAFRFVYPEPSNFTYLTFYIEYTPIGSMNLSYTKTREDLPYAIEQYSSSASGLSILDRVAQTQQEQVDRVGNETLIITQVTRNYNNIRTFDGDNGKRPLIFKDDLNRDEDYGDVDEDIEYTIFRMSYAIKNYKYDVSYVGSKDAILKNYFTSIRTKYRAYQNVDYNQAVTRKEKDVVFVRIAEDYYDGDDKIKFFENGQQAKFFRFKPAVVQEELKTVFIKDPSENFAFKVDLSKFATNRHAILNYEDYDNVSPGLYLDVENSPVNLTLTNTLPLGGVPQKWYMFNNIYRDTAQVIYSFLSPIDFENRSNLYINNYQPTSATTLPKVNSVFDNFQISAPNFVYFMVCDNNKISDKVADFTKTFYKDISEVINYTVEFSYYTTSEHISWTERFIRTSGLFINPQFAHRATVVYQQSTSYQFKDFLKNDPYVESSALPGFDVNESNLASYFTVSGGHSGLPVKLTINWHNIDQNPQLGGNVKFIKLSFVKIVSDGYEYYDYIAFERGSEDTQEFYITLNDTKSDFVLSERNGILYKSHKVATGSDGLLRKVGTEIWYRESEDND